MLYTPGKIDTWPGEPKAYTERRRGPFKSTPGRTLRDLQRELGLLRASEVMIRGYWQDKDFRRDGSLRADARPTNPGVIVEYYVDDEKYRVACDTFQFWEDNLKAIAKTLENLRAIARYGVVKGEQYVGFKALPEKASETLTPDAALTIISSEAGIPKDQLNDAERLRHAIRVARARSHPDTPSGSQMAFIHVQAAAAVLGYTA